MNKLIKIAALIFFLGLFSLVGLRMITSMFIPNQLSTSNLIPTPTPKIVDVRKFSIQLPEGWVYEPQTGIDSFVGSFRGEGITLSFDYGYYSNPLANEGDIKYSLTYETIDGQQAKLVKSNVKGKGLTGVYFGDIKKNPEASSSPAMLKTMLNVYGENIPEEKIERLFEIFRSIRFSF